MLSVKNISFTIGKKILLDQVSVDFEPAKLNLIIGPNGAGKSTLVKLISHSLEPQTGQILYGGEEIQQLPVSQLSKIRAVLSQNVDLSFPLKVSEVVMMGRYPHFNNRPSQKDEDICIEAMRFFHIEEFADRDYPTLSGGEKQRVHFARVMAQVWEPAKGKNRYLILDEPLTFLDVYYQFDFMRKLSELVQAKDIVVVGVVHDLNLAAAFADKIVLLHEGKILGSGSRKEVLTTANIKTAYGLEPFIFEKDERFHLFFS